MKIRGVKMMWFGVAAAAAISASASAGPTQLRFHDVTTWGQTNSGGPFEAEPIGFGAYAVQGLGELGAAAGNYLTFCVEFNEHIGNNTTYNAKVNTSAVNGGVGGGNPDPLDARTAFLYTAFLKGTLDNKLFAFSGDSVSYGTAVMGEAVQEAIWFVENEITNVSGIAANIVAMADAAVGIGGEWFGKGIGSVRILNLTDPQTGDVRQDQLVLIPLPSAGLLGLAGLVGMGVLLGRRMVSV